MGGKCYLKGGFKPWLPDHRTREGQAYRRGTDAGLEITGPINGSQHVRIEIQRYAIAYVVYERAAKTWADLSNKRDHGKGKRPNARQVERAARRLGLADITLRTATERLEELAAKQRKAPSLADYLAQSPDGSAV